MKSSVTIKQIWDNAAKNGLILGAASIAYMLLSGLLSNHAAEISPVISGFLSLVLWAAKFGGCLYLLYYFMAGFVSEHPGISRSDSFKHGLTLAFTSALVYSAFYLAYILFINPELFQQSLDTAMEAYRGQLDSNAIAAMDSIMDKLPAITFFTNLAYCTLFGTIAGSIISHNLVKDNPFEQ